MCAYTYTSTCLCLYLYVCASACVLTQIFTSNIQGLQKMESFNYNQLRTSFNNMDHWCQNQNFKGQRSGQMEKVRSGESWHITSTWYNAYWIRPPRKNNAKQSNRAELKTWPLKSKHLDSNPDFTIYKLHKINQVKVNLGLIIVHLSCIFVRIKCNDKCKASRGMLS